MADAAALFAAIESGDVDEVSALVAADPPLAAERDPSGVSAVLFAHYRRRADVVDVLVGARPELDVFEAAALGHADRLTQLIDGGADAVDDHSPDGFTPVQLASYFGHADAVRSLVQRGADLATPSQNAMAVQPLHAAAAGRHTEVVVALLAAGADPDARQHGAITPLMQAAAHGDGDMARALLDHGADPFAAAEDGRTPVEFATEAGHEALAAELARAAVQRSEKRSSTS